MPGSDEGRRRNKDEKEQNEAADLKRRGKVILVSIRLVLIERSSIGGGAGVSDSGRRNLHPCFQGFFSFLFLISELPLEGVPDWGERAFDGQMRGMRGGLLSYMI